MFCTDGGVLRKILHLQLNIATALIFLNSLLSNIALKYLVSFMMGIFTPHKVRMGSMRSFHQPRFQVQLGLLEVFTQWYSYFMAGSFE